MHRPFRFAPPPAAATAVPRPRLLLPLSRRFEMRLITIEAGGGFGKTTLLGQAVGENALAPRGRDVWLACEPADSSASLLLAALLRAISGREVDEPPEPRDVCDAVWNLAPEQVCLVLDDVHHIEAGSPGEHAVRTLLADLPANGHLVLASRRLPEVGRTRLAVQHQALHLTHDDLALDAEESSALAANHGVAPDIVARAGGWPALAELHARLDSADARQFVWEEVVAPLDDPDRNAFLLLVALGGADTDALIAATGAAFDRDRLASLPLVAADNTFLRPHAIWEELLAGRIDRDVVDAARGALATELASRGSHAAAVELLLAARAWKDALALMFEVCNDLGSGAWWSDQLVRWSRLLPVELRDEPEAAYLRGTIARDADPWSDVARAEFRYAVRGFSSRGDLYREILCQVRLSQLAWLRGDRDGVVAVDDRGTELVAAGWPIEPLLAINRAAIAEIEDRPTDVIDVLGGLELPDPQLRHLPPLLRVFALLGAGDADAAAPHARDTAAAAPPSPLASTWEASFVPAMVAWARGDVDAAVAAPLDDPGILQSLAERVPTLTLLVVMSAHLGAVGAARSQLARIDALVPEVGTRELLAGYRAIAGAAVAVAAGDEDAARAELSRHLDGRPLDPVLAGRAVRWFPALPYLFHEPSRSLLEGLRSGPSRRGALDACRALLAARAGTSMSAPSILDDPRALVTALPAPLATELAVRAVAARAASGEATVAGLADLAPHATRHALQRLAADADREVAAAARSLLGSVPIPPAHSLRIEVLGPARLIVDGAVVDDANWRRQRVRQLVCALVAHREIRRERLGALLWPDFEPAALSANLRMTLSYVQALFEPGHIRGHAPWFLQQDAGVLRLTGGDLLSVDAWELEAALAAAETAAAAGAASLELEHLQRVLDLWRGEYLDDVAGEEWAEPARERVRSRFVTAAVRAGQLLVAAGRPRDAMLAADAALAADRWCEAAHEVLASAWDAAGDTDGARRAMEAADRRLAELELDDDAPLAR